MEGELELPPGFRFFPTDEELVNHYLCRKCAGQPVSAPAIADLDLYKFDPWLLPEMNRYGEKEWYFFSPRDRKYPNGSRPNRAAGNGFWKATGADKPIGRPEAVGIKKALVFYAGKPPHAVKTDWIMHEYRLANVDRSARNNDNFRLDDWVLCRIYNKKGIMEKHYLCNNSTQTEVPSSGRPLAIWTNAELCSTHIGSSSSNQDGLCADQDDAAQRNEPRWNDPCDDGFDLDLDFNLDSTVSCFQDDNSFASQESLQVEQVQDMFKMLH